MASKQDRLSTELSLLESMYPDNQITYNAKASELHYTSSETGAFTLRIPDSYLDETQPTRPEVLSARNSKSGTDLRNALKGYITTLAAGEEILDSIIYGFNDLASSSIPESTTPTTGTAQDPSASQSTAPGSATVIIYLHHLLATSKRKLAISPTNISGVTKPGYPGVLIFSGPATDVWAHVNELKSLNWQAFQVRLESEEEWEFRHGKGVMEVEGMGDVVAEIDLQPGRKEMFMESMRMK